MMTLRDLLLKAKKEIEKDPAVLDLPLIVGGDNGIDTTVSSLFADVVKTYSSDETPWEYYGLAPGDPIVKIYLDE